MTDQESQTLAEIARQLGLDEEAAAAYLAQTFATAGLFAALGGQQVTGVQIEQLPVHGLKGTGDVTSPTIPLFVFDVSGSK